MSTTLRDELTSRLSHALAGRELPENFRLEVTATTDPRHGDYTTNAAMMLAKPLRMNPRALAMDIIAALDVADLCAPPEIAGPGFLNFRLLPETLARHVEAMRHDPKLGVPTTAKPRTIIIDFSSPNIAKPMHVGHIRSTFLGDSLARTARFLGHHVITDNHIGDWGKQFGMILHGWKTDLDRDALKRDPVAELVRVYREVNARAKTDESVNDACNAELAKLQGGDEENSAIWRECVALSLEGLHQIYARLDVEFDHFLGESFYNDRMGPLVKRMLDDGIAKVSDGAVCVFFPDLPALAEKPCLVQKSDGTFNYAASDLATIEFRLSDWKADAIWYVVGAPQQLHFQEVFAVADKLGWKADFHHIAFGSILGENRKMMKTRSGENVQLGDLLDEAVERARAIVEEKNQDLSQEEKAEIAETIGIGAVKYAELSQHRMTDYIFSWDKMLSFQGNTAPYLLNSYVRISSIFRKLEKDGIEAGPISLDTPEELVLARLLTQFGETTPDSLADFRPNALANHCYELARAYHSFHEACPVLRAEPAVRDSRLRLIDCCRKTLKTGLGLLGIRTLEKM